MPKLMLTGDGTSYSMRVGQKMYSFVGGRSRQVPMEVALAAQNKRSKDKPLFEIEEVEIPEQNEEAETGQTRLPL